MQKLIQSVLLATAILILADAARSLRTIRPVNIDGHIWDDGKGNYYRRYHCRPYYRPIAVAE